MRERVGHELRKFVSPELIFGVDARLSAGRACRNLGARRVLVVTDVGVMAVGWAADVITSIEEAGFECSIYSDVSCNPRAEEVMAGAEFYRTEGCDVIVAVGGGSVIDCAKGIGIVSSNRRHILEFVGADRVPAPMPPLVCVPTTGGTSADLSQFAIFTDLHARTKVTIVSKAVVPDVSLVDPRTLTTMDPYLTACTGMDALVHAIEAFASNAHSPLTDVHALEAIRLIRTSLPACMRDSADIEARTGMMLASLEAGLAFSNASLGAVHAMAHSLGGALDLPHGECNSILLAHVVAFNFPAASERYDRIGEALGLDWRGLGVKEKAARLVAAVDHLRAEVGIHATLGQRGVRRVDIPDLTRKALQDVCIVTNPRRASQRDVELVYEEAL
ncbi:alcohol dehydrogenase-like regulatory protein ErcA [Polyangium spumosum]|uniref:Iron-containing alcohol dehydrogenase n=1 Tax=Polyangium spumosum TaxID=889282 RepID=A0A6N7PVS8_9BACT|nr:alcohol dehydrogenase-like regulatory protein ErcA [Polyangium spumosum]MRG96158.1 iron-containing alcohol dehydrogenase [Polyangium spumosum]